MKKIFEYGGSGFDHCAETGKFEVKTETKGNHLFTKLSKAMEFYESLNEEKAFWDITVIPELIDAKVESKYPKINPNKQKGNGK